ncbi:MAG: DNA-3-methyladenine glycosylase [Bacteroidota bacterium]
MHQHGLILPTEFYTRDVLDIAPDILGKILVRTLPDGTEIRLPLTEIEIYRGMEDKACHASKGMTLRNRVMFGEGGHIYMYLVYGMHWMFNIVTGPAGSPEALLIRGAGEFFGPGKVTQLLQMDGSFYGESIAESARIRIENAPSLAHYSTGPRVGIKYAGEPWISKPWRLTVTSD